MNWTIHFDRLAIYFGNAADSFEISNTSAAFQIASTLKTRLGLTTLTFPNQLHSNIIVPASRDNGLPTNLFKQRADGLSTQTVGSGIGIITADCMPIVVYNKKTYKMVLLHAGWKGIEKHILNRAIQKLLVDTDTDIANIYCFIGPSARKCCYEVSADFPLTTRYPEAAEQRGTKQFFDLATYSIKQLQDLGILLKNIDTSQCSCTICNNIFCSYRRQKDLKRQPTVAAIIR